MKLVIKKKTTLGELPNGSLFLSKNKTTLAMKSEYYNKKGASESFIVDSGCMFWGGAHGAKEQLSLVVWEVVVVDECIDIYTPGDLNTDRIAIYTKLAQDYNIEIGTVREIFCKGADWGIDLANGIKNGD